MQVTPLSSRQGQIRSRCQQPNPSHTVHTVHTVCTTPAVLYLCSANSTLCVHPTYILSYNKWLVQAQPSSSAFTLFLSSLEPYYVQCSSVSCFSESLYFGYFAQLLALLYTDISSSCKPRPSHRPHARGQNRGGPQRPGHSLLRGGGPQGPWSIIFRGCSFFRHC